MRAQSIKEFLVVGYDLRYLIDVSTSHYIYGDKRVLDTIHRFVTGSAENGLAVTARAASELYEPFVSKYEQRSARFSKATTLTIEDVATIREVSLQVQTVLLAEAEGVFSHITGDKRFATRKLLDDIASLMSPGTFRALPMVAKYDFGEAGRCIAFELPTAAAFHLMRGTEDVLKHFYCNTIQNGRVKLMWGPMVADLRNKLTPAPVVLLNNLDNLRAGFRNPTQHPEKIYDIEEAQDLLALSIDAVNRMMKLVRELRDQDD